MTETIETPRSSNIDRMEYDPETQRLRVTFKGAVAYDYFDVPADVIDALGTEATKVGHNGGIFTQRVKNAGFKYAKVDPKKEQSDAQHDDQGA